MLRHSFILLDAIGAAREQQLFGAGITSWSHFLHASKIRGISSERKLYYNEKIRQFSRAYACGSVAYFARILPQSQMWRLFEAFSGRAVFLDIETTGLGHDDRITVVGLYDGIDTKIMVDGVNLDRKALGKELQRYELLVTFNGASFDLPFIERCLPNCIPRIPHIDLRHACFQLGYTGGLKKIEKMLGILRPLDIDGLGGGDAATLWRMYRTTGDEHYLDILLRYNEEDIINLRTIACQVARRLKHQYLHKYCACDCNLPGTYSRIQAPAPKLYKETDDPTGNGA